MEKKMLSLLDSVKLYCQTNRVDLSMIMDADTLDELWNQRRYHLLFLVNNLSIVSIFFFYLFSNSVTAPQGHPSPPPPPPPIPGYQL